MNVTIGGVTYKLTTEADLIRLLVALEMLQALAATGKAA